MKNKTLAVWLTLLLGSLGLQRFYLAGRYDRWAWLTLVPCTRSHAGFGRLVELGSDSLWRLCSSRLFTDGHPLWFDGCTGMEHTL